MPKPAQAGCGGTIVPCGREGTEPCQLCHIFVLLDKIINLILTCFAPVAATFMLVLGGFYFLIAGPSPEFFKKAKDVITAVVIGLVIIFASWLFLNTLLTAIGAKTGLLGSEIICP